LLQLYAVDPSEHVLSKDVVVDDSWGKGREKIFATLDEEEQDDLVDGVVNRGVGVSRSLAFRSQETERI